MLQRKIATGIGIESRQTGDSLIGDVPARSQIEALELFETPGDEQQSRVGNVAASAQVELV